jgi:hypothetical protein
VVVFFLRTEKKLPHIFISLKVALGAQEAPQNFLELSLIGKAKIDQGFLKGPPKNNHPEYNFQSKTVKLSYFTLEKSFFHL